MTRKGIDQLHICAVWSMPATVRSHKTVFFKENNIIFFKLADVWANQSSLIKGMIHMTESLKGII